MKKVSLSLMLVGSLLFTQGCSVQMTERQVKTIGALVVIGAAIAILSNNSKKYKKKRCHSHHDRHRRCDRYCRCRRCR